MATVAPPPPTVGPHFSASQPRPRETSPGAPSKAYGKTLRWLAIGFIVLGVIGRLTRYFLQFPIWCDEAFVCLNFLDRDYLGLMRGLEYSQVAPVLFLWAQLAAYRLLGASELAMRLAPFLAGLTSLGLFWRLAHVTVKPLPAALAVGLLAVSRWPVTMSAFAKPYSFDLLMTLLLLVPAVEWLRRPQRLGWLAVLALLTPVALLGSYPAVFVAGAVSVALLPAAWRAGWGGRALFVAYNLVMVAAFLGSYWIVGQEQLDPVRGSVNTYLQEYWAEAFPPASPWPFVKWLALIHTGRMMAYPLGESNGGSSVTFLLFLVGAWAWWKSGRRSLLALWLTPFALNFVAAALHRYPYGGCCRLSQHMAPAICLLTGLGVSTLLERWTSSEGARWRWAAVLGGLFALCAIGGMIFDVARPYHDGDALWQQRLVERIRAQAKPEDPIVVAQRKEDIQPVFRWYTETTYGDRLRWNGQIDEAGPGKESLWVVNFWIEFQGKNVEEPPPPQTPAAHGWALDSRAQYNSRPRIEGDPIIHCAVYRWIPAKASE
jgi:Dolichyl-phosphate-mannose-protein mannosyltransferase